MDHADGGLHLVAGLAPRPGGAAEGDLALAGERVEVGRFHGDSCVSAAREDSTGAYERSGGSRWWTRLRGAVRGRYLIRRWRLEARWCRGGRGRVLFLPPLTDTVALLAALLRRPEREHRDPRPEGRAARERGEPQVPEVLPAVEGIGR